MKLEKDRLLAKLDNLEASLRQIQEQEDEENKDDVSKKKDLDLVHSGMVSRWVA